MNKVPKYKALRLFVVAIILYFMLIWPVTVILYITNTPRILGQRFHKGDSTSISDATGKPKKEVAESIDSIKIQDTVVQGNLTTVPDTLEKNEGGVNIDLDGGGTEEDIVGNRKIFLSCLFTSFLLGFFFSLPYKIYFRRKRRGRQIPIKIERFCRKTVLNSPLILASIIAFPFFVHNLYLINRLFISDIFVEAFEKKMGIQYWAIFLLAGTLTVALVYFWQKHNVRIVYLQHIFTKEELRKRIFKRKSGRIRNRLVLSSFLTTLLPLCIVVVYLLMSLTSLSDVGLYAPTNGEFKVIFGEYFKLLESGDANELIHEVNFYYINVVDTMLLFGGIGAGIIVTIIYLLFFVHWTNSDIVNPVNELLVNMQKTTAGQLENYSLVRTNDELGILSENYNIMTSKLHEYISHIDKMNAELEQKVKERTAEIQAQKEEIEAQRDEVETQRDEIERQRDYVIEQRDLIMLQKKAITDSIEYAANIQSAVLPPLDQMKKILDDHFIYFKPRDIVSGDFYWAHKIKKKGENRIIVVAADSTGHGVPGAFMSMLGLTLLNEIIVKKGIYKPSEILDHLKDNVVNALHQTNDIGKSKDGIDIAVCNIDIDNRTLEYAGAYNPIYIARQVTDDKIDYLIENEEYSNCKIDRFGSTILYEIRADKNPIGISHKLTNKYTLHRFNLKPGDSIYLFTDGFADQFGGNKRLKFLYSRFKEMLAKTSSLSMDKQKEEINNQYLLWKGDEKQIDDILIVGIRIN